MIFEFRWFSILIRPGFAGETSSLNSGEWGRRLSNHSKAGYMLWRRTWPEASKPLNRHSNPVARNAHSGDEILAIATRIIQDNIPPPQIRRQVQINSHWRDDEGSLSSKSTHKEPQFENHVIPNSFVFLIPTNDLVVSRKNKDSKIMRPDGVKQALKTIGRDVKDAL